MNSSLFNKVEIKTKRRETEEAGASFCKILLFEDWFCKNKARGYSDLCFVISEPSKLTGHWGKGFWFCPIPKKVFVKIFHRKLTDTNKIQANHC